MRHQLPSTTPPFDGFGWKGKGKPGTKEGAWYNPETEEQLRPDLDHLPPQGPHWDYENEHEEGRLNPDGTYELK